MSAHRSHNPPSSRFDWRMSLLMALVSFIWLILAVRLVHLQKIEGPEFARQASQQRLYHDSIPARPGEILDRQGRLLATTITARSLFVVPSRIPDPWPISLKLGKALNLNPDQLFERIARRRDRDFLWIERRLDEKEEEKVRNLDLPPQSWGFREEYLRCYPQGKLAAHVIGLRDIDRIGRGGVEQSFDAILKGRDGKRVLVRDARGRVIAVQDEVARAPRHGQSIRLTIDAVIQLYAEQELEQVMEKWKPKGACAVVLDPQSGDLLAMASRPTFDPNRPRNVPDTAWKNRALAAVYEPGSTFKPFVVAWGLNEKKIQKGQIFDCEQGVYRMGRRLLHDHHPYGKLSLTDVLVKSSNIGMAKIGEQLTNKELYRAAISFGFGSPTGVELPGELPGILRPLEKWNSYSTGSIPMGQELAVTPLQLITAHAALANGGILISPRIVHERIEPGAPQEESEKSLPARARILSHIVRSEVARWVVQEPMREVVRRGTGTNAQIEEYEVFGKTGTAQKSDPQTGEYSSKLHVSSFLGGAPADDPQVLVLVVVDEPSVGVHHYGGTVAAPSVKRILRKTLIHLGIPGQEGPLQSARKTPFP